MVIGLVVVMANCSGCGLVMGVVVWITEPYGALAARHADRRPKAATSEAGTRRIS
jgi:hypothetical protein